MSSSERLSTDDLIEIARTKSQAHLLTISGRKILETPITDILVERGNNEVHRKLAASPGAQFSEHGYSQLIKHAETDDILGESLGQRFDIPLEFLRQLIEKTSQIVRDKLIATAPQQHQAEIRATLAKISAAVTAQIPPSPDFDYAIFIVKTINAKGELNEGTLLQFAKAAQYEKVVAGLSLMSYAPIEMLDGAFRSGKSEPLMISCKVANLSWTTVQALLLNLPGAGRTNDADLVELRNDYSRLSVATAQRVIRFWQVQRAAGKDVTQLPATASCLRS